jgi:hypothetical protein
MVRPSLWPSWLAMRLALWVLRVASRVFGR